METLPDEHIVYVGDTARVPYGIKSEEMVAKYALQITDFLIQQQVKMILIACNTVSASAKQQIIERAGHIPVLDVITSGTEAVFRNATHQQVGVIGTLATVHSRAYVQAIHEKDETVEVVQQACPLLVPLAEEGWLDNRIARLTLDEYLTVFKEHPIDSLILGCTHYPLFKDEIARWFNGNSVSIIDSAESIAQSAKTLLQDQEALHKGEGSLRCFVTDRPQRFQELAERFLGQPLQHVEVVSLEEERLD